MRNYLAHLKVITSRWQPFKRKYQQLLSTLEDNGEAVSALQDKNDRLWNFLAIIAGCEISDYPAMDKKIEIIRSLYQVFCGNDLAIQSYGFRTEFITYSKQCSHARENT